MSYLQLDADEVPSLAAAHARASTGGALSIISSALANADAAYSVARASLAGPESLLSDAGYSMKDVCSIVRVASQSSAAAQDGAISRERYLEEVARASNGKQCTIYIVPLARAHLSEELAFVSKASSLSGKAVSQLTIVTSDAAPVVAAPRSLQSTATTVGIMMVPEVMEGLLIGLVLIFFTLVGLTCVMGIQSPDVLHSTTLPAGKEY